MHKKLNINQSDIITPSAINLTCTKMNNHENYSFINSPINTNIHGAINHLVIGMNKYADE